LLDRGKKTYLDDVMKEGKKSLAPNQYSKPINWNLSSASGITHGHSHKDEFRKSKRETLNEEIIRLAKANKGPAPGAYVTE